jgi:ribosomal protein L16/L10AE
MAIKWQRKLMYKNKINVNDFMPYKGDYKIISLENKIIDKYEIEASRILLSRELKKNKQTKKKKLFVKCGFYLPYTKKGSQSRMGKGKGLVDSMRLRVHVLDPLFELPNLPLMVALKLRKNISHKLSVNVALVDKNGSFYPKLDYSFLFD